MVDCGDGDGPGNPRFLEIKMKTFYRNLLKTAYKILGFFAGLFGMLCFFGAFAEGMTPGRSSQASMFLIFMLVGGFASAFLFFLSDEV